MAQASVKSTTPSASTVAPERAAIIESRPAFRVRRVVCPAAAVIVGAALIFAGIKLMHDVAPFTLWPGMPTLTLGDEFSNPQWVVFGTIVLLAGSLAVAFGARIPRVAANLDREGGAEVALTSTTVLPPLSLYAVRTGVVAAVTALAAYTYVVLKAPSHQAGVSVLVCLVCTPILIALSLWLLLPAARRRALGAFPDLGWVDGVAICVASLAFIVAMLYDVRYWFYAYIGDEWSFFDLARSVASGNSADFLSQAGVYGIHPYANSAYTALIMRIFGINVTGWRLSSMISVAAAVPPLYLLGTAVGGRATAIAASVFYTSCHLLWAFAHIGYNNNDLLLVVVAAAALLYAGLRTNRLHLLFAAGACGGAAWYTLFTGRLMIGILALVLLTEWGGGWRSVARRLGVLVGGFAVVVLPLIIDNGADTIRQMFPLVNLSQDRTSGAISSLLQTNTIRGIYAFFYATENAHYVIGEVFDAISAAALGVGFIIALRHIRELGARLLLIWFLAGLLLTTPLYYASQIADTRLQIAIPPAALLAGWGLVTVADAVAGLVAKRARRPVFVLVLLATLIAAVALNVDEFYRYMPAHVEPSDMAMTLAGIQKAGDETTILAGRASNANLCQMLQGFEIDTTRVLQFQNGSLVERCPPPNPPSTTMQQVPTKSVTVLIAPQEVSFARSCTQQPESWIVRQDRSYTLWAITVPVVSGPPATFLTRLASQVTGMCPALIALPPS